MRFIDSVKTGPAKVSNGLDYFVLKLPVLGLVFIALRRIFGLRRQRIFRSGWQMNLKHFFVSHARVQLLLVAAMVPAQSLFASAVSFEFQQAVAGQPLWLQFIEILLAVDLVVYWVHRAFHLVPWLRSFHATHHSSREMDWPAGSRVHLLDALVTRAAGFLPVFILGFSQAALVAYVAFVSFRAVFFHANVRWRFPVLRWLIAPPEYHH